MPDLSAVLASLFSGEGAHMLTAVVDTVGVGVCTITYNGGQFDDVPFLKGGIGGIRDPAVGEQVYVVAQEGWGMFILGAPEASAPRTEFDTAEAGWTPSSVAHYETPALFPGGRWTVPGDSVLRPNGDGTRLGHWFYPQPLTVPFADIASAHIRLQVGAVSWEGGLPRDRTYLDLFLHNSADPSEAFTGLVDSADTVTVAVWPDSDLQIPLPFAWVEALLAGTAKGIGVLGWSDPEVEVLMDGYIEITSL